MFSHGSYNFHGFQNQMPGAVPVPGDMPSPQLRKQIILKTGVPELEWAAMYVPVLSVLENIDEVTPVEGGVSFRIVGRRDLAQKLQVDESWNFGVQLFQRRVLTSEEALFLDTDFFRDATSWRINFKIQSDSALLPVQIATISTNTSIPAKISASIPQYINHLEASGLIERWWAIQQVENGYIANVGTSRLTDLLRAISGTSVTLNSVNGSVLYS